MALYQIKGNKLLHIHEKQIDLEKQLQSIVEYNLSTIFDLEFVASEFAVKELRVDTLAFNPSNKSFTIIEYKKDKSTSIIDQGLAYLNLLLENKAEFVLKYNEAKELNFRKMEIQWDSSKIIFIANAFTKHQERAASFEDLPIELWEVELYENNFIYFTKIEINIQGISLKSLSKDKTLQKVAREIKKYKLADLLKSKWNETNELYEILNKELISIEEGVSQNITKYYIAYMPKSSAKSFVEIVPQKQGLKIYLRQKIDEIKNNTLLKIHDCSIKGHWTNGNSYFIISSKDLIADAMILINQSFDSQN